MRFDPSIHLAIEISGTIHSLCNSKLRIPQVHQDLLECKTYLTWGYTKKSWWTKRLCDQWHSFINSTWPMVELHQFNMTNDGASPIQHDQQWSFIIFNMINDGASSIQHDQWWSFINSTWPMMELHHIQHDQWWSFSNSTWPTMELHHIQHDQWWSFIIFNMTNDGASSIQHDHQWSFINSTWPTIELHHIQHDQWWSFINSTWPLMELHQFNMTTDGASSIE